MCEMNRNYMFKQLTHNYIAKINTKIFSFKALHVYFLTSFQKSSKTSLGIITYKIATGGENLPKFVADREIV